jgi:shikimate dehydrogenase
MPDRYAVIGNPIGHSKSPWIHAAFARQLGQVLEYHAVLGALEDFEAQLLGLAADGLRGCNVTLPFKERALTLASNASERAVRAGAANTLTFGAQGLHADNTDGYGLLRDLCTNLQIELTGRRILVLGAGGAVRGILAPLLQQRPQCVHLLNRSPARAQQLVARFVEGAQGSPLLAALEPDRDAPEYDLVINGTSASLSGELPTLPPSALGPQSIAYDLAYRSNGETLFMSLARAQGATLVFDGLGMLVEQAAESFSLWRGVRPSTAPVLQALRAELAATV